MDMIAPNKTHGALRPNSGRRGLVKGAKRRIIMLSDVAWDKLADTAEALSFGGEPSTRSSLVEEFAKGL